MRVTSDHGQILNTVRAWHTHVSIIRQTGLPTSGLTTSEAVDILLKHHLDSQGLSEKEKTELMADPRSKKMVFWAGYEREFRVHTCFSWCIIRIWMRARGANVRGK